MLAAAGAVAILLAFLPDAVEVGGAAAILVAALITAGERGGKPGAVLDWWNLLAAGALLAVVGVPLSLLLETIGGLIAGVGAALALIAAAFGW